MEKDLFQFVTGLEYNEGAEYRFHPIGIETMMRRLRHLCKDIGDERMSKAISTYDWRKQLRENKEYE